MSSRKATRARQSRKKLLASLWEQLERPGIAPETAVRLTKQIAKLEGENASPAVAAKDAVSPALRKPKSAGFRAEWLRPDSKGVLWVAVFALERLARRLGQGYCPAHEEWADDLDAYLASLPASERAALEKEARQLAADAPSSPQTPRISTPKLPAAASPAADAIFTEADAVRHFRG